MIVNIRTQSDQDFERVFVLSLPVSDWVSTTYYPIASDVAYAGQVWSAPASSTNVQPGTDGTKWTLSTRPALDLTGSTLMMMARSPAGSDYAPLSVTSVGGAGIVIDDDPTLGKFTLTLANAALLKVQPGTYQHSLIRLRPDGLRELIWRGSLTHEAGPTR